MLYIETYAWERALCRNANPATTFRRRCEISNVGTWWLWLGGGGGSGGEHMWKPKQPLLAKMKPHHRLPLPQPPTLFFTAKHDGTIAEARTTPSGVARAPTPVL